MRNCLSQRVFLLVFLAVGAACSPLFADCTPYAVVVGVSKFPNDQLSFPYGVQDAKHFAKWFEEKAVCRKQPSNKGSVHSLLLQEQASRAHIRWIVPTSKE